MINVTLQQTQPPSPLNQSRHSSPRHETGPLCRVMRFILCQSYQHTPPNSLITSHNITSHSSHHITTQHIIKAYHCTHQFTDINITHSPRTLFRITADKEQEGLKIQVSMCLLSTIVRHSMNQFLRCFIFEFKKK